MIPIPAGLIRNCHLIIAPKTKNRRASRREREQLSFGHGSRPQLRGGRTPCMYICVMTNAKSMFGGASL